MSSFRAEAYGAPAAIIWLSDTCKAFEIERKHTWHIYTDNQGLVTRKALHTRLDTSNPLQTDFDVTDPWHLRLRSLHPIDLHHVRGHQDAAEAHVLSLEEELNVYADELATRALQQPCRAA